MIDIHTHVLPGIDDGSDSVEETVQMLHAMVDFGVKKVVATPHFYHDLISVEEFLEKRNASYLSIADKIPSELELRLGAEVMLSYDLYKSDLRKLAIEGTDYILIEMPYNGWDPWVFDELFKISSRHALEIIIAHVDRYVDIVSKDKIDKLFMMKLKYQANIDDLGSFFRKSNAMKLMKAGKIHFIGSDCHNMSTRVPCMGESVKIIKSKLGNVLLEKYMNNAEKMLG